VLLLIAAGAAASAQGTALLIQNGRVEPRPATSIEPEISTVARGAADAVWMAWRVPLADGLRGGCCTFADDSVSVRGCFMDEPGNAFRAQPQIAPATGPVSLDSGTGLVVLARIVESRVERLRTLGDDCPIDANGRTVYWLQGVSADESVKFLDGLVRGSSASASGLPPEARLREAALGAIARHRATGADAVLDRVAASDANQNLQRTARSLLGSTRGAHGFSTLQQLLATERLPDNRRQLVSALGQTGQSGTAAALLAIAQQDNDARVRAEAAYWLPQRGGRLSDVLAIVERDANDTVKQKAVEGLGRVPPDQSTPLLIQLADTSSSPAARKAAVSALGRSRDPKAIAYLEDLIRR
jgi:hypothetical protein